MTRQTIAILLILAALPATMAGCLIDEEAPPKEPDPQADERGNEPDAEVDYDDDEFAVDGRRNDGLD